MKFTHVAFVVLGACAILVQAATAQVVRPAPGPNLLIAMEDTDPSPSDLTLPSPLLEDMKYEKQFDCGSGDCFESKKEKQEKQGSLKGGDHLQSCAKYGCGGTKGCGKCCEVEAWELMPRTRCGWKVGGWLQGGYHTQGANGVGTGMFNDYPNKIQMQQAWIYAEKEADTGGCGWDWGVRMDYVYGTDGPDTQAFGNQSGRWDEGWDNGGAYGHAIPQAYGVLAYNNLNVKMGHFYTICGYEVVQATGNFFYSHAYTMYNAEPFTHTGVLADWTMNDIVTVYGGWTQGWDTGFNDNNGSTFLGGFSLSLTDQMSLTYTTTVGDFGNGVGNSDATGYSHSVVFDWQVTDRLNYVAQSDFVDNDLFLAYQGPFGLVPNKESLSVNQYLIYRLNPCWGFGARLEWFRWGGYEVSEVTLGANWSPHKNLVIRPEIRGDIFESGVTAATGLQDSTTLGVDAIVTF